MRHGSINGLNRSEFYVKDVMCVRTSSGGSLIDRKQGAPLPLPFRGSRCDIMVCTGTRYTNTQGVSGNACMRDITVIQR